MRLVVEERASMSLLGLVLSGILERRLADPRATHHLERLHGALSLRGSGMQVTMELADGDVRLRSGAPPQPTAEIAGTLSALVDVARGRSPLADLLSGRLSVRGSPRQLWHFAALLRARNGARA